MVGRQILHYEILEKLGEGGMGAVYRAEDQRLGRHVALKMLPPETASDPERLWRFEREARAVAALNHPNIVTIHSVESTDEGPFLTMELVEGETLEAAMPSESLPLPRLLDIAVPLAEALAAAHERGVVHRDLKPANVMITRDGTVKVLDFGLAKLGRQGGEDEPTATLAATAEGAVLGTVRYMSPEQALGKPVDERSDLFSLGAILYEMATGRHPFAGSSASETLSRILSAEPEPVTAVAPSVPRALAQLIEGCLEKDPDRRRRSAAAVAEELRALATGEQAASAVRRPAAGRWRRAALAGGIAVALLAGWLGLQQLLAPELTETIDSIAVLPFENRTGDPDADFLGDGLAESLIHRLSNIPDLRVISRPSAFRYRDGERDPMAIGRELDARAVLLGRIERRGEHLRVSADLIDALRDAHLWGEKYTQSGEDLMQIEERLAADIGSSLTGRLSPELADRLTRRHTEDPEAYRLYLRGREYMVGTVQEMSRAVELLEEAITREPGYALARATLARAYVYRALMGVDDRETALSAARREVETALRLDPELAEAYIARGMIAGALLWDWRTANAAFERALELNPSSLDARLEYADYLVGQGNWEGVIEQGLVARRLDPLSTHAAHWLAIGYVGAGDYEAGREEFQRAIDLNPGWGWGYLKLAGVLARLGRTEEAAEALAEGERLFGASPTPLTLGWIGGVAATLGDRERAEDILERLDEELAGRPNRFLLLALIHASLGRMEQALALSAEAIERRAVNSHWLALVPGFFSPALGEEPEFQRLLQRMRSPA